MKTDLVLLYGGKSAEHEVSLNTAKAIINVLDTAKFNIYPVYINREGKWICGSLLEDQVETIEELQYQSTEHSSMMQVLEIAENNKNNQTVFFPLLHGPNGEDGTIQGMFELMNLPYVGNGVLASAAGMDKVSMKMIFAQVGLKQAKYLHFLRSEWKTNAQDYCQKIINELGFPCFVKPANLGSSVGISKCIDEKQLTDAVNEAFQYDRKVVVEEGIDGREIELAVLGNDNPACSVAGELIVQKDFYDYKAKYVDGSTGLSIPADLSEQEYTELSTMAIKAFKALDCSGLVRADFFLTHDHKIYINEINTMPGFTPFSMYPLLWQESGLGYSALIEKLIELALERYQEKQLIKYTF